MFCFCFSLLLLFFFCFFSKSTVPPVKRTIVHFHDNSQATRWNYSNYDNRITRLTENVSKTKNCIKHVKNCKKSCPKSEKMLKFCSKVKKVLNSAGNVKSAERYLDMPNNRCFQFPLGVTREIEDNGYAKFGGWGANKVYVKMVNRLFPSSPGAFSQGRLCTWPHFESEGFWNSEVAY